MNQRLLTTFSIVAIKHFEKDDFFYLGNKSFIRSQISLSKNVNAKDFQNSLFYVEVQGNNRQFNVPIEFQQQIMLRHKVSNKYLSFSDQFQEQQNDTTYRLELSQQKHYFKILPCFQYQTKISSKVKFNQDIYLASQINNAKIGFVSTRQSYSSQYKRTVIGLNYKSKFVLHNYYQLQKEETNYTFGSIIWLSHIESSTFLSNCKIQEKQQIVFEQLQLDKDIQTISGLWLIQSQKFQTGGKLHFQQKFMLKNLYSGAYLSFSKNYKLVNNQRVYNFTLEDNPTDLSKFIFRSLKGEQNRIKKGSYLVFKHFQSTAFIGCRKRNVKDDIQFIKPLIYFDFSDQDLFKIIELSENQEEAVRFIFAIKEQLGYISKKLQSLRKQSSLQFLQIYELYDNILKQLLKLQKFDKIFLTVQKQLIKYIQEFSLNICQLRKKDIFSHEENSIVNALPKRILKCIYEILRIICKHNRLNQEIAWKFIHYFIDDLFFDLGSQQLLIAIFQNNYSLLCKVPDNMSMLGNKNIVKIISQYVMKHTSLKNQIYWLNIQKILNLMSALIYLNKSTIDINQRLISEELFDGRLFEKLFFPIKIRNQRIQAKIPSNDHNFIDIQTIKDPIVCQIIQGIFYLFSSLCANRNFIAKRCINKYLSQDNKNGPSVLISYLTAPISKKLSNYIYILITNLYIDSCPRINRYKPLSIINFAFNQVQKSKQNDEANVSGRRPQGYLLKEENNFQSKQLEISNLLLLALNIQPTLNQYQLDLYKDVLNKKLTNNNWSQQLIQSMIIILNLESYTVNQIIENFDLLTNKLRQKQISIQITTWIMELYNQMIIYIQELELKKMTSYLKYKFKKKQLDITTSDIGYLLPESERLYEFFAKKKKMSEKDFQMQTNLMNAMDQYNDYQDILSRLYSNETLKLNVLKIFIIKEKRSNLQYLRSIFKVILNFNKPKYYYLRLLMNSIVVTNDDGQNFQTIFQTYKKMKHLISISQSWLCSDEDDIQEDVNSFFKCIAQLTNYLYQNYEFNDQNFKRNRSKININKQLTLRNLGVHIIVFELLQTNFYLLEISKKKRDMNKKHIQTFEKCFQFIHSFCYKCNQNKEIVHDYWHILNKFRDLVEVGQTEVYIQLINKQKDYIKQIKPSFVEKIVLKIVKNIKNKGNQVCQFNPEYLKLLQTIIKIGGKYYRPNLQKIYKFIQKEGVFRKIFFMEQKQGKYQLCLDMYKIKNQPIQVPYIYHYRILKLINIMINQLESVSSSLKFRIESLFGLEYLIQILCGIDIYSNFGIQAQLNFLVKRQVLKLVSVYLDKNYNIAKLYDSEILVKLLRLYQEIFVKNKKKTEFQVENQALYINFLEEHKVQIAYYQKNQRQFYLKQLKPFLLKLHIGLSKFPHHQTNKAYQQLTYLIENIKPESLLQQIQSQTQNLSLQSINIKWRNFVDDDVDNSLTQKFAKKSVLQILRNNQVQKILNKEKKAFYQLIKSNESQFLISCCKLLQMLMEEQITQNQPEEQLKQIHIILRTISEYFQSLENKEILRVISVVQNCQIIENLINYTTNITFDFNKINCKKIFYEVLRIFNRLMVPDQETRILKLFYKIFHEDMLSYRFFNILNQCILQISELVSGNRFNDHVNNSLGDLYLCVEDKKMNIQKECLQFITNLCNYTPFTSFLRFQSLYPSIDFLQKIYNTLTYILYQQTKALKITVPVVSATQDILQCISSMLNGGNKVNQSYIIDNKFPQIINDVLKIQSLKNQFSHQELAQRDRLLNQVIQFYESNGIDIRDLLNKKIKIIDFRHIYLINRLKESFLRTVLECVAGNQRVFQKIKLQIPIEFLKINIIWIYQDYKQGKYQYKENIILRKRQPWDVVVQEKNLNGMFLLIGFYFYILIDSYSKFQKDKPEDEDDMADDKERNKQKIVKKFFRSIMDKEKQEKNSKNLQNQPFAQQMRQFYEKYYEALEFFKNHTLTIEINLLGSLSRVYFPKIPLCYKLTNKKQEQFKIQANRISHQEKIKSLLEFAEETYTELQGEQDFFNRLQKNHPILAFIIKSMRYENQFLFIAWVLAVLQTILFLISNYQAPTFSFVLSMFVLPKSSNVGTLMFIIQIFNIYLSLCLFVYIFSRKIPVEVRVLEQKYEQEQIFKQEGIMSNKRVYVAVNTIKQVAYLLFVALCLIATFLHPMFAGFLLAQILNRIQIGKQILRSIKQTWFQLFIATSLLIFVNLLYSMFVYVAYASYYSPTCQSFYQCLLLLLDQSLKSDSGFLGTVPDSIPDANGQSRISMKLIFQIFYILFAQKVIFDIFSGTIIDKFSELREETGQIQQDEEQLCYICGQQRFIIDFEQEGFEIHRQINHKAMNYVFYIYYLKRIEKKNYGIVEKYIEQQLAKQNKQWIPNETSLYKEQKQGVEEKQEEEDKQKIHHKYVVKKIQDYKKIRQSVQHIMNEIKNQQNL